MAIEQCTSNTNASNSTVQIPANIFNSLVASVDSLRDIVSQLGAQNDVLRKRLETTEADLLTLQRNCGMKFPKFSKLPAEIRR
jgi:predicted translin family RNA/ssDNA-binding protein